ncbi:hypothetical protein Q670_12880 [Alcanivorax sp. P2S70]|uniref:sulfotransferase family 2 domain-containing protein n=1 Tax=Alcanivorax sp. P2S70 TaxID=1397527 RepID=UPI0003B5EEF0|nr:sulfotransferase family 2 domain-containing protein [Alcanivorax sp. P2S70]ERP91158.1 hypothetical protein Q670_12880 [Alcanivorax sp. P2S70]
MGEKVDFMKFFAVALFDRLKRVVKLVVHAGKFFVAGKIEKPDYLIVEDVGVAYLVMPKAACTSIKRSMVVAAEGEEVANNVEKRRAAIARLMIRGKVKGLEDKYVFTYVRNPFARLVSAYINKFEDMEKIKRSGFLYDEYLGGYLKLSDSFEEFVRKIAKIPDRVCDRHFMSQSYLVDHLAPHKPQDIFKLEEINESYPSLVERFGFSSLEFANRSASYDYRDYYKNKDILDLVFNRYREDVERFGYQSDYQAIKEYMAN